MLEPGKRDQPTGVLFLCYANVCRSPLAEAIFRHLAAQAGRSDDFEIDSAGISALAGSSPHRNSVAVAKQHGIEVTGKARQLLRDDLFRYTHILVMDRYVLGHLGRLLGANAGQVPAQVRLFQTLANPDALGEELDVQDPITGTYKDFEHTFNELLTGCHTLLTELTEADRA